MLDIFCLKLKKSVPPEIRAGTDIDLIRAPTHITQTIHANYRDYTNPFQTCRSSGNLVDALPLAIHNKDAVLVSCLCLWRASIGIVRCRIVDYADTYRLKMRVHFIFHSFLIQRLWN